MGRHLSTAEQARIAQRIDEILNEDDMTFEKAALRLGIGTGRARRLYYDAGYPPRRSFSNQGGKKKTKVPREILKYLDYALGFCEERGLLDEYIRIAEIIIENDKFKKFEWVRKKLLIIKEAEKEGRK